MKLFNLYKQNSVYIRRTLKIAWPVIFEQFMLSLVSLVDSAMVGSLGAEQTGAIGINMGVTWLINGLPSVLAVGGTVLVAYNIGAGNRKEVSSVSSQVMGMTFVFGAFVTLASMLLSGFIPSWMGAEAAVLPNAVFYLRTVVAAVMFNYLGQTSSALLRGAGNTRTPMFVSALTNVINVALNFILIYKTRPVELFGLKFTVFGAGMGVKGAGIASAIAMAVTGSLLAAAVFAKRSVVRAKIGGMFRITAKTVKSVLKIGLPALGERISTSGGQIVFQRMISSLGNVMVSAHFLTTQAESISYMPAGGFSMAATTLVGQSFGEKDKKAAQTFATVNLMFSLLVGLICLAVFLILPGQYLSLFTSDADVIAAGKGALMVIAFAEPFFTVAIVLSGILRGSGDTKLPMFATLIGMWGIRLASSAFFIFVLHLGLTGAWLGMGCDLIARSAVLYLRYRKKDWIEQGQKRLSGEETTENASESTCDNVDEKTGSAV